MRIVHLNPFYFPYAGGIERRIRSLARRMARTHEVHVVTAQQPGSEAGEEREDGFMVHRLPSRFLLRRLYNPPLVSTPGLEPYLERLAPDVVDYHFRWSPGYNRAFRRLECAGVATYHNTYGEGSGLLGLASRANDRLFMRTMGHARKVICVSDFIRRDLAAHGVPAERLVVSHNALEPSAPLRAPATPPHPRPFALAIGRVVAVKGFDILVDAWRDVPDGLDLVVVGSGPAIADLRKRAGRRGVADRIRFAGWVSEEEKETFLASARMYLHPARFEAFGISVLEALAAGLPVVAADVGGIPEVVGGAGPLLPHDPSAWAKAVQDLHADEAARRRAGEASLAQSRRFDWDRIGSDLVATYEAAMRR